MSYERVIIVAHPDDETLKFSSILAGALVVCVTDGNNLGRGTQRKQEFIDACNAFGAAGSLMLDIPDVYPHRLPERLIAEKIQLLGLDASIEVYTHSPFDAHPHHRSVAYATSLVFPELNVEAISSLPSEVYRLTDTAYKKKLMVVNSTYSHEIRPPNDAYVMQSDSVIAIESFTRVNAADIIRALALTQPEIRPEHPDVWGFNASSYEMERMDKTVEAMEKAFMDLDNPRTMLELGACEGIMTASLRARFPDSFITAVEPNPLFAARLTERTKHDDNVTVVEVSALNIQLDSEVVIVAEMLYYLVDYISILLSTIKSNWLVTSYFGQFDADICKLLQGLGWCEVATATVAPRFEPVDGINSRLIVRRAGTNIRVWRSKC